MKKQIFVNLPVKDLTKSMDFFKKLGFDFNMQFTNEQAACMIIEENIFSMLITHEMFKTFTKKKIADSAQVAEVLVGISAESKEKVNQLVEGAMKLGGSEAMPAQDYGWMFQRSFNDLDGHTWEIIYIDETQAPK